jgi:hypothetical protein
MNEQYSLDALFRVKTKTEVTVRGQKRTYYLRTISEAAEDFRQNHAVAKARQAGRELKDTSSLAYEEFFGDIDEMTAEEIVETQLLLKRNEFEQEARREIHAEDSPEPPDNPTVADIVDNEEQLEEIAQAVEDERQKCAEEHLKAWRDEQVGKPIEELREGVRESRRLTAMNIAFSRGHRNATLYHAVYTDKKYEKKLFETVQEVYEADPNLTGQLTAAYNQLDAWSEKPEELKN